MKLFIQIFAVLLLVFSLQISVSAADNVAVEQIRSYHVDVLIKMMVLLQFLNVYCMIFPTRDTGYIGTFHI